MYEVDASRAAGVRSHADAGLPQALELGNEVGIKARAQKVTRALLEYRKQKRAVHQRYGWRRKRIGFGQVRERAQFLDGPQRVEMSVTHRHLAARVARIDDVQVVVRVAKGGDAAQLDVALGWP